MKRIIITAATLISYLALIVNFEMHNFLEKCFPNLLTEEGYLPEYLHGIHDLAFNLSVLYLVLVVFYIGYSALSKTVTISKRYLWAWLIFIGHFVTIPFFWYYYVWNEKQPNQSL
jgi:hypothetical protein